MQDVTLAPSKWLLTVSGIGKILALTIALETGDIGRFESVGDFASYSRCVNSVRLVSFRRNGAISFPA